MTEIISKLYSFIILCQLIYRIHKIHLSSYRLPKFKEEVKKMIVLCLPSFITCSFPSAQVWRSCKQQDVFLSRGCNTESQHWPNHKQINLNLQTRSSKSVRMNQSFTAKSKSFQFHQGRPIR